MTTPAIITLAITGSQPTKGMTAVLPVTPPEQIESTHEAFEAGTSLVHIHVRDEKGLPSSDPDIYAEVQDGVRKYCPGMIIQFSTGGRGYFLRPARGEPDRGDKTPVRRDDG